MAASSESPSFTAEWLHQNHELYTAATNHSFIASIREGSIDVINVKHWMEQDYYFVREFVRFVASVLLKVPRDAPEQDLDVILGGLTALESEISWFRKEANFWQVFLERVTPLDSNREYCAFLQELEKDETPYPVAVAAFWVIELVYNASFTSCLAQDSKTPFELLSTVKRWGSPEFYQYVLSLKQLADKALKNASEVEQKKAHEVTNFLSHFSAGVLGSGLTSNSCSYSFWFQLLDHQVCVRILELEIKFWDMANILTG